MKLLAVTLRRRPGRPAAWVALVRVPTAGAVAGALLLLAGCHGRGTPGDSNPDSRPDTGGGAMPGVLRLGPPAPAVGIYGVAAPEGFGRVYVSNLHVPFITVLSDTGEWLDGIDIRPSTTDGSGCADFPYFPRLYVTDDVLWVTDTIDDRLCRYDLRTSTWLDPLDIPQMTGAAAEAGDGLWVGSGQTLVRADRTGIVESVDIGEYASALTVADSADEEGDFAVVALGEVSLIQPDGTARWTAHASDLTLQDVALIGDTVYVTERETGDVIALTDGAESDREHTGSDTFAIRAIDGALYVSNRQGAALPASGAYEGAPGMITALSSTLDPIWSVDLQKTIHFLAFDGERLWTANEDSLTVSGVNVTDGVEEVRTDRVGLTIDSITSLDGQLYTGSHLTDEIWEVDPLGAAVSLDVCGWPLLAVPLDGALYVPCEETGEVWALDATSHEPMRKIKVADTFFPDCGDGLCTSHDVLIGAAQSDTPGELAFTDGYTASVRWIDDAGQESRPPVDLGTFPDEGVVQHFDVLGADLLDPSATGVVAFEPRSQAVYRVVDGVVTATWTATTDAADFPLVLDGDRVWVGDTALAADLQVVARLPDGSDAADPPVASAADGAYVLGREQDDLVVWASATLEEVARLPLLDLRVPPYLETTDTLGPLRFLVDGDVLIVGNTMRGTLERRGWPDLTALGPDDIVGIGRWADLEGAR